MAAERWTIAAAAAFLLAGFAHTLYSLRGGRLGARRWNLPCIAAAFLLCGWFLYLRGQALMACPLNTLPDLLAFLGWATMLLYFATGASYRLSLLGAFTAPLVFAMLLPSVLAPGYPGHSRAGPPDAWVELHAALSAVAYGAFGLAAVAGAMYLVQERLLKKHRVSALFYNLPPIGDLSRAGGRLLALGFLLLTVAFASGFLSGMPVDPLKNFAALVVWALYGTLVFRRQSRKLSPRAQAVWSVAFFLFALVTLPGVHYLSCLPVGGAPPP